MFRQLRGHGSKLLPQGGLAERCRATNGGVHQGRCSVHVDRRRRRASATAAGRAARGPHSGAEAREGLAS